MSDQLDKKSILEMSMGAILERVDYEMGKVMDNILDPNTKATAKRKISVTLELIPSADRRTITIQSTAKCSLTPTDPVTTSLYITNAPSTGELMVAEMVPQVPGQLALDGEEQDHPKILKFKSVSGLDSIVKLVRNELDMFENLPVFIRVDDARTVSVFTTYDDMMCRDSLYTAKCDVPGFRDGFREYEQAIIGLRSKFSPGPGVDYLLDLLSRMSKDSGVTTRDNGVSQEVEARQGVSLKALVQVKPRVALRPFRTFLEVEQPVSEFLLRLDDDGNVGLFEADGGMWQQTAKASIAAYFEDKLAEEVKDGKIVVMM